MQATNYHLGTLKAKLAKLRSELFLEQSGGGGGAGSGEGFAVARNGDARVALIGFPSGTCGARVRKSRSPSR
jgi:ribosome-interacting GTPase 1